MRQSYYTIFAAGLLLAGPAMAQQNATPVFVYQVERERIVDEIEALGTLKANENVELSSSVTERVTAINFTDGQRVNAGDILVEMDTAEEQALLAEEQSVLDEAQRQVDRLKPLIARGATSRSTMDEAELDLQTATSRIAAIQAQIQERTITAPFDGRLGLRNISVGAMLQPGTLITTIDDDTIMKLDFAVPEVYLNTLTQGSTIAATTKAFEGDVFEGTVASIDSRVDPVTRSISVRALLNNPSQRLKPGMLMRVKLQKNPREAVTIPEEAIVARGGQNYAYVVDQGANPPTVSLTPVDMGSRRQGVIEAVGGIKEGDLVVTHGTLRLSDGARITIKAQDKGNDSLETMLGDQAKTGQ